MSYKKNNKCICGKLICDPSKTCKKCRVSKEQKLQTKERKKITQKKYYLKNRQKKIKRQRVLNYNLNKKCDCGEPISNWSKNRCKKCWLKILSKRSKLNIREKNSAWNGGFKKEGGYIFRNLGKNHSLTNSEGYIRESHYVWLRENLWGMFFTPKDCCIHHINGKKNDNRIENLICVPKGLHSSYHNRMRCKK